MPHDRGACAHLCRLAGVPVDAEWRECRARSSRARGRRRPAPARRARWHSAAIAATGMTSARLRGDVIDDDELRARSQRRRRSRRRHRRHRAPDAGISTVRSVAPRSRVTTSRGERDGAVGQVGRSRPRRRGRARTDRSTALTPVVTFGTNTRSSGRDAEERRDLRRSLRAAATRGRHGAGCSPVQLAQHEPRRLSLHLVAQRLLLLEDASRRRAHRAVIEVGDVGIEEPVLQHGASESRHALMVAARCARRPDQSVFGTRSRRDDTPAAAHGIRRRSLVSNAVKILGHRRLERHLAAVGRMPERQPLRVQRLARKRDGPQFVGTVDVAHLAHQRVAAQPRLNANLVALAGDEPDFDRATRRRAARRPGSG